MTTKRERYLGTLVGVLCGDALGAPYETWDTKRVQEDLTRRGGLTAFDYPDPWERSGVFPKGRPTDDSDHTAALAMSIVACGGVNQEDIFTRLRAVTFGHHSPLWDGKAVGAGKTTRNMLRPASWQESQVLGSVGAFPSNGSLMRAAPLALYFGYENVVCSRTVQKASEVTHRHPIANDCCFAYCRILGALLEGKEPWESFELARTGPYGGEVAAVLTLPKIEPRDPEVWPGRGAAVLTLQVACWALVRARSFCEGLTDVIGIGGDTDTYGAVAGGLLGARFGIAGIPSEWRDVLLGRHVMEALAERLFESAHPEKGDPICSIQH